MAIAVKLTNDMDVDGFELLNANSFNGVALTDSGSAGDFLNAQGDYITIDVGDLISADNVWTGTNQFSNAAPVIFDNGIDMDGSDLVSAGTVGTFSVNSVTDLLSLKTLGTARITMTSSVINLTKNTIIDTVASIEALDGVSTTARFGHKDFNLLSGFGFAQRNTGEIDINAATGQNLNLKIGNVNKVVVDSSSASFSIPIDVDGDIAVVGTGSLITGSGGVIRNNSATDLVLSRFTTEKVRLGDTLSTFSTPVKINDTDAIGVPLILANGGTENSTSISMQNSDNSKNIEIQAEFFSNEELNFLINSDGILTLSETQVVARKQLHCEGTLVATTSSFYQGIANFEADTKYDANFAIRNKDDTTDISFITRNVTGSEVVMDFTNIGEINGVTLTDGGAATNFLNETGAYSTPVASVDESLDYDWTGLHTFNNAANTPVDFEDGVNTNQANYIINVGGIQKFFVGSTGSGTFSNGTFGCGTITSSGNIVANTGFIQTASILRSETGEDLILGRNGSSTAKITVGASATTFADEIVQDGSNEFGLTVKDPDNLISSVSYNKTIKFTDSANAVAALIGYTNGADNDFDIYHNAPTGRIRLFTEGTERISITESGGDSLIDTPSGTDLRFARSGVPFIELGASSLELLVNTNVTGFLTTTSLLQVLSGGIESTNGVYQTGSDSTNLVLRTGGTGDSLTINDTAHTATFTSGVDVVADDFSGTFTGIFNNSTTSISVEDNDNATIQVLASDQFIIDISTGGNPVTYDLEASPSAGRRVVIIRDQSTNTVTVDGNGNNIGTRTTSAATEALADQEKLDIIFDGVIWYRL